MSIEVPKDRSEILGDVSKKFFSISEKLVERKSEGQNNLFGPDSEKTFLKISELLESEDDKNFEVAAKMMEDEVNQFGKHAGRKTVDNIVSLSETIKIFNELSENLDVFDKENPNIVKMSKLAKSVENVLKRKRNLLSEYLNN